MKKKAIAVILAAGQGKRMNTPVAKQFLVLGGKPVLYYSIRAFEDSLVDEIIVVCGSGQIDYCTENIIIPYGFNKVSQVIEGGKERYDSVNRALLAIEHTDYVLIHDGARPFISVSLINDVIDLVKKSNACIVATPAKDTIKIVDQDGYIKETPNRELMWLAQTPQAFEYSSIRGAYELLFQESNLDRSKVTDDAMVYEQFVNKPIKIVKGDCCNIKLTTVEDLNLAKGIINLLEY